MGRNAAAGFPWGIFSHDDVLEAVDSTHTHHEVLQLWWAGRTALVEAKEVLESIGQWLALTDQPEWAQRQCPIAH